MNPLTLALIASGGILGALAVSANQRNGNALASASRGRQPAMPPPLPPQLPASTIPSHAIDVNDVTTDTATAQSMGRAPRVAAQDLYTYVTELVRADRGAELGSAAKPNATVRDAQRDMKLVTADGIYGTKTRARGKELLGREFPAREAKTRGQPLTSSTPKPVPQKAVVISPHAAPAVVVEQAPAGPPPPPSQPVAAHSPQESAAALLLYVSNPKSDVGSKKKPNATVRAAQKAMGGLTADGIYGPKTRARIHTLTGKNPPR
jgi:hypothetical protein